MEQLVGLEKDYAEFTKRGLPVVAISPEPVALIGRAQKYAKTKGGFPFPMLASKDHRIFRAYRAWDDFEDFALHAVAIVDGQQRLRWLDVSYEPFMNLKFVAEEAERLLKH
jgi:alkyl hydroperoxide reductase subunit AhpC